MYRRLIALNRELEEMNFLEKLFSKKDESLIARLNDMAQEARAALFVLGSLYFPEDMTGVSFESDMAVLMGFVRSL